jgi:hypothetical protein
MNMIDKKPAALTAAAVSSPLMAEAMVNVASTKHMTSIKTIPTGVLTTSSSVPAKPPFAILVFKFILTPYYQVSYCGSYE